MRHPIWFFATLLTCASYTHAADVAMPSKTDDGFCLRVQHSLAGTQIAAETEVHKDYVSFKKSKASIKPLVIHQFVQTEAEDAAVPALVSCKTKTADLLRETYGADVAEGSALSCRDINRAIVMSVWRDLDSTRRNTVRDTPDRILLDGDVNTLMGSKWVSPYDSIYRDASGQLHVFAKSLRVDWDDMWFSWAPDRIRGVHYCHLVAPEHLRRVMLGDVQVPQHSD